MSAIIAFMLLLDQRRYLGSAFDETRLKKHIGVTIAVAGVSAGLLILAIGIIVLTYGRYGYL
jgi:hypothetical protein